MPKNKPNRVIGAIAALAICITAIGAGSAQADSRNAAGGALAALLGLVVIGAIIQENKEDERRERRRAQAAAQAKKKQNALKARPLPPRVRQSLNLPQSCVRDVRTANGNRARILGQRCMDRTYRNVRSLPRTCERVLRTDRGVRRGWSARCLRREGYQIAAY